MMTDESFLRQAIALARQAREAGEDPFAALLVHDGVVVHQATEGTVRSGDPTAHAELRLIRSYCRQQGLLSLEGYTLYTSAEPCPMCAGAIHWARLSRVVFSISQEMLQRMSGGRPKPTMAQVLAGCGRVEIVGPLLPEEGLDVFEGYVFAPRAERGRRRQPAAGLDRRFCSHCGAALEIRVGKDRPRYACPQCGRDHYEQLKVGAGALIERDGRLLLLRRTQEPFRDCWNLPAGYVEADESPEEAAVREVREETGLEVVVDDLAGVHFFADDPRGNGIMVLYRCRQVGGRLAATEEGATPTWFALAEIPPDLAGGGHNQAIGAWGKRRRF